jgi:hypothetical protein
MRLAPVCLFPLRTSQDRGRRTIFAAEVIDATLNPHKHDVRAVMDGLVAGRTDLNRSGGLMAGY